MFKISLLALSEQADGWPCNCEINYPGYHGSDCASDVVREFVNWVSDLTSQTQLTDGQRFMDWISVKDKPVPLGEDVLVTDGSTVTIANCESMGTGVHMNGVGFGGYEWEHDIDFEAVTHWIPVPNLPKGG